MKFNVLGGFMTKGITERMADIYQQAERATQELNRARAVDFKEIFKPF